MEHTKDNLADEMRRHVAELLVSSSLSDRLRHDETSQEANASPRWRVALFQAIHRLRPGLISKQLTHAAQKYGWEMSKRALFPWKT